LIELELDCLATTRQVITPVIESFNPSVDHCLSAPYCLRPQWTRTLAFCRQAFWHFMNNCSPLSITISQGWGMRTAYVPSVLRMIHMELLETGQQKRRKFLEKELAPNRI